MFIKHVNTFLCLLELAPSLCKRLTAFSVHQFNSNMSQLYVTTESDFVKKNKKA